MELRLKWWTFSEHPVLWYLVGGATCGSHMAVCFPDADRTLPAPQIPGPTSQNGPPSGALAEGGREACPRTL